MKFDAGNYIIGTIGRLPTEKMHPEADERLAAIRQELEEGNTRTNTARELLAWFGHYRRGYWVVRTIRQALSKHGLRTEPDFEGAWIDGPMAFVLREKQEDTAASGASITADTPEQPAVEGDEAPAAQATDPRYRIGRLESANTRPTSVTPDTSVSQAATIMLANDFTQLPVMNGETPKGMVSWRSIGKELALGKPPKAVRDCMTRPHIVERDASLFDTIGLVRHFGAVLVRDSTNKICGIVTANDFSQQFRQLAEPFLLLGEIENQIRAWIEPIFSKEDLQAAKDPNDENRQIEGVSDLTLGELLRLLENSTSWGKLGTKVDRKVFVEYLENIRRIRNDVMHFDSDGVAEQDLDRLRSFARFLEEVRGIHEG